jgi:hypothetical protein
VGKHTCVIVTFSLGSILFKLADFLAWTLPDFLRENSRILRWTRQGFLQKGLLFISQLINEFTA